MATSASGLRWAVNCSKWRPERNEWIRAMASVQEEERTRVNQFVFRDDAVLSLVGRLLIRHAVAAMSGAKSEAIVLSRSSRGKPILVTPALHRDLHFNVSHQGSFAVLATEWDLPVGVDVMQLSRPRGTSISQFFRTMHRQFTGAEWRQIQSSASECKQLRTFYRFWCLKESYIKAIGTGLSLNLQRLSFTTSVESPWELNKGVLISTSLMLDGCMLDEWLFEESLLDAEHCVAVARRSAASDPAVQGFTELTAPQLVESVNTLRDTDGLDWDRHQLRPNKTFLSQTCSSE